MVLLLAAAISIIIIDFELLCNFVNYALNVLANVTHYTVYTNKEMD